MSLEIPETLGALQSNEQVQVLDTVDALRTCGLDGIISLPQLVVCGDQSSGKSSVLEAITEIPFPRKENLCTRFATEAVLRRSKVVRIAAQIIPDKDRSQVEQDVLKNHRLVLSDMSKLPALIDEATKIMGLDNGPKKRAFSRDVLRIIIEGPNRPAPTLVDLPGVIHSESRIQSAEDVQVISRLVEAYISNPQTIILPIVSAMNDAANQIILKRAREHDPNGQRTLGIITKPDVLSPGSENEDAFIALAANQNIAFEKGWHVLRGRGYSERNTTFVQRNATEAEFFSKGRWLDLDPDNLGIDALRVRLSELLFAHVKQELPRLRTELETASAQNAISLQRLGEKRTSLSEQRQFLTRICTSFRDICKAAVDGHYDHEYFGEDVNISSRSQVAARRLRAIIQKYHIQYAEVLRTAGHKYNVVNKAPASPPGLANNPTKKAIELGRAQISFVQHDMNRTQVLEWAKTLLNSNRGREMVGSYNPMLIGELFRAQSQNWQPLAEQYLSNIAHACISFCKDLLLTVCPKDNVSSQLGLIIEEALKTRGQNARDELEELIRDKNRPPITFNHYLTLTVNKKRMHRLSESKTSTSEKRQKINLPKSSNQVFASISSPFSNLAPHPPPPDPPLAKYNDVASMDTDLDDASCPMDMEEYSCLDALDYLNSYYKVALKTYTDNTIIQCCERHLVDGLQDVLSPLKVASFTDSEIAAAAAEPAHVTKRRAMLEAKRESLEKGRDVFSRFMTRTE